MTRKSQGGVYAKGADRIEFAFFCKGKRYRPTVVRTPSAANLRRARQQLDDITVIEHVMRSKPHPEQGYRSALGILRLSNKAGKDRLERACERALAIGSPVYRTIKTMLKQRMETAPLPQAPTADSAAHLGAANVRGRRYYH
ncbi:MAG: DUF3596 domain-containing protein [Gammaproteobacteria bacterium]